MSLPALSWLDGKELSFSVGSRADRALVQGVSLSVGEGEVLGILGPNGAGKTTLLKLLGGLLRPAEGTLMLAGRNLADWRLRERTRLLAYMPQSGTVPEGMCVEEVASLGLLACRSARARNTEAELTARCLSEVGLLTQARQPANTLSGGEKARLFLARALVTEAPVLLADEPVAALDPAQALHMLQLLRARTRARPMLPDSQKTGAAGSCVLVLHDLTLAARFCDRIALLHQGRLVALSSPASALTAENLRRVYGILPRYVEGVPVPWNLDGSAPA
ncbi:ABC transporter ATP-binding protein [Oecophyllibacter saccharovorans]|uniref:ABC transporter ATP-binding protein n=1 Tax=Oecophyllibacter saccharovorans TaxID=2558360 RepID=UPI001168DDFF|nr:ABC transporter ATP-binding protein [Oecophyllibacter saccharovorans]TPW33682.1 ABC transporter ATP-binding protein [Oecophyllibacter saccharovorans]